METSDTVQMVGNPDPEDTPTTIRDESAAPIESAVQNLPEQTTNDSTKSPMVPIPQVSSAPASSVPKARLPHDRTGILEDRIKEDPRGDTDAWLSLIQEHRKRNKLDEARAVYDRFLIVFPHAAEIWVAYTEMELENDNLTNAETIFGKSLLTVPNVQLWSVYLNYIRRRNDLINDVSGQNRTTISLAYDFVLDNIGIDKDSGRIWQDYIQFAKSAPGQVGGNSWQDQQKMDQVRSAYQRAVNVPMSTLNVLWKEYDAFELSLNKATGRKFTLEKMAGYMSARTANNNLENLTHGLLRTTIPKLAPAAGFEGDQEYTRQVDLWKKWITWEQEDPLSLKDEDPKAYKARVLYVYKQAVMTLRFWPEMWVNAAEWCYNNDLDKDGDTFLDSGIAANPESCLIAFKKADRLESTLVPEEGTVERGNIVRAPFDKLLDTLYDMIKQLKIREARDISKLEESLALDASISAIISKAEDDDEASEADEKARETNKTTQTKAIQDGYASQARLLSRTISFSWIALMRAMRRIQGKGSVKDGTGCRKIFSDARTKGKLTSDVYVASALIEHNVYNDPSGTKIFERGAKLFPEDPNFTMEYLKHLLSKSDTTNARVTFELVVNRLTQKPELVWKAKPLYAFFHKYESQYGELAQIKKLEQRMAELFPEDPKLSHFASRYSGEEFNPTAIQLIVSPSQIRPIQSGIMQSIEQPTPVQNSPRPNYAQENSPRPQYLQANNSPKRPFPVEDMDNGPRKLARGESPLKGAAGRRLDQQKRLQQGGTPTWQSNAPQFVVPRDINFLLSIIPRAETYNGQRYKPEAMVKLLRETIVPDYNTWRTARDQSAPPPVQRYEGMKSSSHYLPPSEYQEYTGQAVAASSEFHVYPQQVEYRPQYSYAHQGMSHERDAYLGQHGYPLRSSPFPDPVRSGYVQESDQTGNPAGRKHVDAPDLAPASFWYDRC